MVSKYITMCKYRTKVGQLKT